MEWIRARPWRERELHAARSEVPAASFGEWIAASPLWLRIAVPAVTGAMLALSLAVPALVRHAVVARCEQRQLSCEIGAVRFGFGRLWLRDLSVADSVLSGARVRLDNVQIRPVFWGAGVRVFGGRVELRATTGALRARAQQLISRDAHESGGARSNSGSGRPVEIQGLEIVFADPESGARSNAWGVRVNRTATGWFAAVDVAQSEWRGTRERARGIELSLASAPGEGRRLERIDAASAAVQFELPSRPDAPEPAREASGVSKARAKAGKAATTANAPVAPAVAPDNEPSVLAWTAVRPLLAEATTQNFRTSVVALTIEAQRANESLRFGPSRFSVQRGADALSFELVPLPQGGRAEATPLSMRLRLPLAEGRPELDLTGGPVSLSALGVREGDLGLVGVREARLEASLHATLGAEGGGFELSSQGLLENVRLRRAALAPNEISGIRLGWNVEASVAAGNELTLKQADLSLGDVRLRLEGSVARAPERTHVSLRAEVPQAACSALLAAVPHGMAPLLESLRVEGTLALKGRIDFDSTHIDATRINLDVNNQCRISNVPTAISPNRFRNAWWREVKGADGLPVTIQSGPGSPDWTPYEEISPYLETAILVCEDAGFFGHRGIDYRAIENSIRMNLEAGRFLRGGSTVSMQLAKNLYLSKEKTLSRKFQEAVFTQLLEQELSKHELMELYLNVIEFGPGIYGVRQAARYYFNEEPRDLSLGQALYLASILPAPDTAHFGSDGRVKDGWAGYLRKLMQIARKIRRISEEELQAGLAEQVAFRKPSERVTPLGNADDASDGSDDRDDETPPPMPEQ